MRSSYTARPLLLVVLALVAIGCDGREPLAPSFANVSPPASLSASAVSHTQINLIWQDKSTNESGFEVHASTAGVDGPFWLRATTGAGAVSFTDGGLSPSTQYCYRVRAFRMVGRKATPEYSAFSSTACATTPAPPVPNAPSETNAVPGSSIAVSVSWKDNSLDEQGFRIDRSTDRGVTWAMAGTVDANQWYTHVSFWDGDRTPDAELCYRVVAFNGPSNSMPSNMDCTAPPAAPTGLLATTVAGLAGGGLAIDLTWADNSSAEDSYEVQRLFCDYGYYYYYPYCYYSTIAILGANETSYRDTGVNPGEFHSYLVLARRDGGSSDPSNEAGAWSDFAPAAPSSLTAAAVSWLR